MKPLAIVLALLAAAKLAHQEYLFRTATRDAIIGAYKAHAAAACQSDARRTGLDVPVQAWLNPVSIDFVIGNAALDVNLWQVDNALWNARYRNPYLLLTAEPRSGLVHCEYDIVNSAAAARPM